MTDAQLKALAELTLSYGALISEMSVTVANLVEQVAKLASSPRIIAISASAERLEALAETQRANLAEKREFFGLPPANEGQ